MTIVPDDCDERQTRVDQMIDEFRQAQSRRLAQATPVKRDDHVVESQREAQTHTAVAGSTPAPASE
jgi:hypothetical protein